jgi:hypothetical protein
VDTSSPEPAITAAEPPSSPGRHLLTLIVDALAVPVPADDPAARAAYLDLVDRRAGAVLTACRETLARPGDGGALYAARDLFDVVSCLPATGYAHAPARTAMIA